MIKGGGDPFPFINHPDNAEHVVLIITESHTEKK